MICDYCKQEKPDVKETFDPFHLEINDEEILVNLCNECYQIACEDI